MTATATISIGTKLIQKAHPEYGTWTVIAVYPEWLEIRGSSGVRVLFLEELKLWQFA
jgi:hypothetical protein